MVSKLFGVFYSLDPQKSATKQDREQEKEAKFCLMTCLDGRDRHRHRVGTCKQKEGIEGGENCVQVASGLCKYWIGGAKRNIGADEAPEEHHFGGKEKPHSDPGIFDAGDAGGRLAKRGRRDGIHGDATSWGSNGNSGLP